MEVQSYLEFLNGTNSDAYGSRLKGLHVFHQMPATS